MRDKDSLSILNTINHRYGSLLSGFFNKNNKVCFLGMGERDQGENRNGYLIEFNVSTKVIKRSLKT